MCIYFPNRGELVLRAPSTVIEDSRSTRASRRALKSRSNALPARLVRCALFFRYASVASEQQRPSSSALMWAEEGNIINIWAALLHKRTGRVEMVLDQRVDQSILAGP